MGLSPKPSGKGLALDSKKTGLPPSLDSEVDRAYTMQSEVYAVRLDKELLKGATETVLLAVLAQGAGHGYELVRRVRGRSEGVFEFGEGTVYPLLYKLEAGRLIKGVWEPAGGKRRRRVYHITPRGRARLVDRTEQWRHMARGMALILGEPAHA